jgi:hypothetical protein
MSHAAGTFPAWLPPSQESLACPCPCPPQATPVPRALEAGTGLIISRGCWAERCDFGCFIHHGTATAAIDWDAAIAGLPSSGGEKRMLRLAASLAADIPVLLGDAVTGIDQRNADLLARAILHASGRRQFPR